MEPLKDFMQKNDKVFNGRRGYWKDSGSLMWTDYVEQRRQKASLKTGPIVQVRSLRVDLVVDSLLSLKFP